MDRTCQQTSVPPFFCQFFLCRFTTGRNQIIERLFTVACPKLIVTRGFWNRCKYRWIKSKSTICGSCDLQLVLAAFQQSASLIAMQQDQRCSLRIISLRLNAFDAPVICQCDIAAALNPLKPAREARTAGVQSFDESALIGIFCGRLPEFLAVVKFSTDIIAFPTVHLVAEGKTGQLPTMLFFQCCHVVFPYHRRRDTMTGGVLCNQCSIFFAEIIFKCSYLTWHSTEIDPASIRQCFFHLRIAVSGNAALHILGTAKSSKLRKCFSRGMYHIEIFIKCCTKHDAAPLDDLRRQYRKNRARGRSG